MVDRADELGNVLCDECGSRFVDTDLYDTADLTDPHALVLCDLCIETERLEQRAEMYLDLERGERL